MVISKTIGFVYNTVFLQLLIIAFISNVHESLHDDVNGGIVFCIFYHILNKMNIIAHFEYRNAKNTYFMVYFVTRPFYVICNMMSNGAKKYIKV